MSASDQVENRWFSPYERIWHPASNVTEATRPQPAIERLCMYFSLTQQSGTLQSSSISRVMPPAYRQSWSDRGRRSTAPPPPVSRNGVDGRESGLPAWHRVACRRLHRWAHGVWLPSSVAAH